MWDLIVSVPDHCLSFYLYCNLFIVTFIWPSMPFIAVWLGEQLWMAETTTLLLGCWTWQLCCQNVQLYVRLRLWIPRSFPQACHHPTHCKYTRQPCSQNVPTVCTSTARNTSELHPTYCKYTRQLCCQMSNSMYVYGYEYLRASPRLVITPLTVSKYTLDLGGFWVLLKGGVYSEVVFIERFLYNILCWGSFI